jgi:predicted  nucleic acid-binding Zn-ribbon protein
MKNTPKKHTDYVTSLTKVKSRLFPSQQYVNSYTPIKHECKYCGHIVIIRPDYIYSPSATAKSHKNKRNCSQCRENEGGNRHFDVEKYNKVLEEYDLCAAAYINAYTEVTHTCSKGHSFERKPSVALQSKSCPCCPTKTQRKKFKALKSLYLKSGIKIHSLKRLTNKAAATITCTCLKCGNEWKKPLKQLIQPCTACKKETKPPKKKVSNTASLDVREKQMREIIKEKFLGKIELLKYTNKGSRCYCNTCGHKWTTNYILYTKNGCPICSRKGCYLKYTNEQYTEILILNHMLKNIVPFKGMDKPIEHKCLKCSTSFKRRPRKVLEVGCSSCGIKRSTSQSKISQIWLRVLETEIKSTIQRGETSKEKSIKIGDTQIVVDGYSKKLNMVFEFLGSSWHGDPNVKNNTTHPISKRTKKELFNDNFARFTQLTLNGYNVCWVWESQFLKGQVLSGVMYAAER